MLYSVTVELLCKGGMKMCDQRAPAFPVMSLDGLRITYYVSYKDLWETFLLNLSCSHIKSCLNFGTFTFQLIRITVFLFENLDFSSLFSASPVPKEGSHHFAIFNKDGILGTYISRSV